MTIKQASAIAVGSIIWPLSIVAIVAVDVAIGRYMDYKCSFSLDTHETVCTNHMYTGETRTF